MGDQGNLNWWNMPTQNIAEWRFEPTLDKADLVTLVNRSDTSRRLQAEHEGSSSVPGTYSSGSVAGGWIIFYTNKSGTKMKICPELKAPHFKMVPENETLKDVFPFGWAWRLSDEGIGQEPQ
jgi:hypothetical protein